MPLFRHIVDTGKRADWASFGVPLFHVSTSFGIDQRPFCRGAESPRVAGAIIAARPELQVIPHGNALLLSHVRLVCVYEVSPRTSDFVDSNGDSGP